MLKFWSLVSTTSEKAYKNQGQERRKALEDFLNALVDIPYLYNFEEFDNFFTSYN
jgi:PX domain.